MLVFALNFVFVTLKYFVGQNEFFLIFYLSVRVSAFNLVCQIFKTFFCVSD